MSHYLRKGDVIHTANEAGLMTGTTSVKFDPPFVVPETGVYLVDFEVGTIKGPIKPPPAVEVAARAMYASSGGDPNAEKGTMSYPYEMERLARVAFGIFKETEGPVLVARGRAEERERIRAALKDGTPADRAAEVLDYWAERNGAFMVSSVKANNRRSAREAWITAVDRAALAVVDAGVDS